MSETQDILRLKEALKKDFNNLLVKEFTTDWEVQRLKIGLDIDVMDLDELLALLQSHSIDARITELETLKSDIRDDTTASTIENWINGTLASLSKQEGEV